MSRVCVFFLAIGLLTACGPNPAASGSGSKSEVHGTVVSAPGQPLSGSKVVLLDASERELASLKTGGDGGYSFPNLAAGSYRVRFDLQADQNAGPLIVYKGSDVRTTEFFSRLTSQSLRLDGQESIGVAPLVVAWKANLAPNEGHVGTNQYPTFRWDAAPNARQYAFELLKADGSVFFRSADQAATSYQYTSLKGNQGAYDGQSLQKGGEYLFRVRVGLNAGSTPGPEYGYSTVAKLTFD